MPSHSFYIFLALIIGACVPTQAGINNQLRNWLGSPFLASVVNFCVGAGFLVVYTLVARIPLPSAGDLKGSPWWIWCGGILGVFFVSSAIVVAPKLGAASMLSLVVAGQMVASLILDHFAFLGYPMQPVTLFRILGVVLVAGGAILIRWT